MIKKLILLLTSVLSIINANSQAPNFVQTDIYGNTYNLYEQLNAGKTVLLNFYSVGCPSCMQNASRIDTIYQNYNPNVLVMGIESYYGDSTDIEQFKNDFGPITYPMFSTIGNDSVLSLYNVIGTPSYYVVCPDKNYRHLDIAYITDFIDTCLASHTNINALQTSNISILNTNNEIIINHNISKVKNMKANLFDITGKIIISKNIISSETHLFTNNYKGIYILNIIDDTKIIKTQKLVFH
jgi:thiol-disulfide isomerase/thioredoxin